MNETKMFEENKGLIMFTVKKYNLITKCYNSLLFDIDDMYAAGSVGLLKAIRNFDESRKIKFSSVAVTYILNEIRNAYRNTLKTTNKSRMQFNNSVISINSYISNSEADCDFTKMIGKDDDALGIVETIDILNRCLEREELEIATLKAEGISGREISEMLGISVTFLYQKLNVIKSKIKKELALVS